MASKKAAKKVDLAAVSPNWKVLLMKINEDKLDEKLKEELNPKQDEAPKVLSKNALKAKRKRKLAAEKAADEISEKKKKESLGNEEKGELTQLVALDCEYVGLGAEGREDALARVSIVNEDGKVVYDKYVRPRGKVTDYRTHVSGIRPGHLINAEQFQDVQKEVHKMLAGRIVVGHALHNDFRVLSLSHSRKLTRDTGKNKLMRKLAGLPLDKPPSLKELSSKLFGMDIQQGEHDSITDARVALRLYQMHKKQWEAEMKRYK